MISLAGKHHARTLTNDVLKQDFFSSSHKDEELRNELEQHQSVSMS